MALKQENPSPTATKIAESALHDNIDIRVKSGKVVVPSAHRLFLGKSMGH